jgi:hypothetical protein
VRGTLAGDTGNELLDRGSAMRFLVRASVGNAEGVFDAAYEFGRTRGTEAEFLGTPEEIGRELARYLSTLTPEDLKAMRYGTDRFFVELIITPDESVP